MKIFLSESTLYSYLNVKEFFARDRRDIWSLSDSNGIPTQIHLLRKRTQKHLVKLANDSSVLWVLICTVHLAVCYYHIMYTFQSESKKKKKVNLHSIVAWMLRKSLLKTGVVFQV